ncbi:hypothetical protein D3C76_1418450 [compost metagenome]
MPPNPSMNDFRSISGGAFQKKAAEATRKRQGGDELPVFFTVQVPHSPDMPFEVPFLHKPLQGALVNPRGGRLKKGMAP